MRIRILSLAAFALAIVSLAHSARAVAPPAGAANWPGWRGDGSGISSEKNIPIYWSVTENVAWKTPLPQGNSSPVIWSDRIFLTGWADSGKQRSVFCLDAKDGRIVWQKDIAVENVAKTYEKNGYASSTCATDGEKVFAFFDSPGLVALDVNGTVLWSVDLGPFNTDWGMAASPAIYKDVVLMCCDQDKDSFIVALNKADGKERWRTPRPPCGRQYATPIIITVDGKDQIVVNGGTVVAYEPEKGKEIWTCRGMINSLTPSAVFADGLVYAVSGRNGPGVAIDPTGRGDVTDTHVRMHVPVGGPYVPSPLVIGAGGKDGPPILMLPGDDGAMRFVDKTGTVVVKHRVPGHFTSSPVLAEDRIYWGSEKGDVFVVDVSDCTGRKPKVKAITTNALGEKILASPALADGRVYIRSEKHLFCIEGRKKIKSAAVAKASGSFPELKQLFEAHPAPEGDDIAIRLDVVEALAQLKNPEAIPFLKDVAVKDNHWDVSEAAAKALGQLDRSAIPALIELLEGKDWRPYLKVVPAGHLARMQATESIPALTAALKHGDPLVRVACLNALAAIVADRDAEAAKALPAFLAALDDREGIVRKAAIEAVAAVSGKSGGQRAAIVAKLLDCAADRNVLVASAAKDVLINELKAREEVMKDEILYGEQRRESTARELAAGPMRLKFQDGELRYI
ncbi:MAG TPA: PQQ-binding-like beta-propeller repeat protein, partial [Planctomycetota bacterium]|nr:PQQ-binding-like beta-propeller repeat protein [Planctomycetota bacterium]